MNRNWKDFLLGRGAVIDERQEVRFGPCSADVGKALCAVSDHGLLSVTGSDAERFLQGQATCDMKTVCESRTSLGAFCNPKGRVVTTFRAMKCGDGYLLLMPAALLPALKQRLQRYVLRSDVELENVSDRWCLLGLYGDSLAFSVLGGALPQATEEAALYDGAIIVKVPAGKPRYLIIADADKAAEIWRRCCQTENFTECGTAFWRHQDILNGLPAVTPETSEEFTPQMLNLDLLGGIGFKKGCYIGQEIIARTHYLGRLKRRMFLARSRTVPAPGTPVYDAESGVEQSVGTVLIACAAGNRCDLLAVLQTTHASGKNLRLHALEGEALELAELPYPIPESAKEESC